MLFEITRTDAGLQVSRKMTEQTASALGVKEKLIENLIAAMPGVLFQSEEVLVVGQSISGLSMADVLALDASGALIVVEVKRDWSNRETVGQLLEYAASLRAPGYDRLNAVAQRYSAWGGGLLIDRFRVFSDQPEFGEEDLGKRSRVIIVAPESDQGLRQIVEWLSGYGVPISFVAFSLYADDTGTPRLLEMDAAPAGPEPISSTQEWAGHWIFNTNETHAPGAWNRMFAKKVAAIYGYESGPRNLEGASAGEKVLAYVNGQGLRATGTVVNGIVRSGEGIFEDASGHQAPAEYHLDVEWDCIVAKGAALRASEATDLGYRLPVRSVFARLHQGRTAQLLERELRSRCQRAAGASANSPTSP